jgi:hypothetical protein
MLRITATADSDARLPTARSAGTKEAVRNGKVKAYREQ